MKVGKVVSYWGQQSLLIPNVFRLAREIDGDPAHLLEHQDLSKKELLVQSNGQKARLSSICGDSEVEELDEEEREEGARLVQKLDSCPTADRKASQSKPKKAGKKNKAVEK